MKTALLLIASLTLSLVLTACGPTASTNQPASASAKRYTIKGTILSVDKAGKKAKIQHERIEGFMEAMTMDFPIHADWVWDDLTPGSEIKGDLVVDNAAKDPYYVENIGIVAAAKPGQTAPPVNENFAQIGNEVPAFSLTNQDGKKLSLTDFKGKALAITFIYARCPLPEYCSRMSTSFSDIALQLAKDDAYKNKIRLLSISFDPANDTPEKLQSYGIGYLGKGAKPSDLSIWQLAVGSDAEVRKIADFFGLRYEVDANDKTQINHSLRTAVISPEGKVVKIFPGSEWTTPQLLDALKATVK